MMSRSLDLVSLEKDIIGPTFISLNLDYFPPSTVPRFRILPSALLIARPPFESFTESLARIRRLLELILWNGMERRKES